MRKTEKKKTKEKENMTWHDGKECHVKRKYEKTIASRNYEGK